MSVRLGVDLGGTFTKLVRVGAGGRATGRAKLETRTQDGPERWIERLATAAAQLGPVRAAGVAAPGLLDRRAGKVLASPNLPAWERVALRRELTDALGVPVVLENDANAAAVGELRFGAARRHRWRDFVLFTIGTGVGGGVILGGELFVGEGGMAGEVGHMLAEPQGIACGCGRRGCVETVASVTGMIRSAGKFADGRALAAGLRARDAAAQEAVDRAGRALGVACSQITMLLDVRRFLFAGGGAALLPALRPSLLASFEAHVYGRDAGSITLRRAALGDDAGALGAAALAITKSSARGPSRGSARPA